MFDRETDRSSVVERVFDRETDRSSVVAGVFDRETDRSSVVTRVFDRETDCSEDEMPPLLDRCAAGRCHALLRSDG